MIASNALLLGAMTALFLVLGYLGVPVAFALIAGVLVGTAFTPITFESMIAQLFKHEFGAKHVVARLHDPVRAAKYRELGVKTLCTTTVLEGLLEQYVIHGDFPELPGDMSVHGDASDLDQA